MASEVWGLFQYLLGQRSKPRIWPNAREREKDDPVYITIYQATYSSIFTIRSSNGLKEVLNSKNISSLIVGSDQVMEKGLLGKYKQFFRFSILPFHRNDIKKIAHAKDHLVLTNGNLILQTTKRYKQLANSFDAISVREESAVVMCGKYLDVEACHVS